MIIFKQIHTNHWDISFPIRPLAYIVAWGKIHPNHNLITIDLKILAFNMIKDNTFVLCVCFCSCLLIVCLLFLFVVFVSVQWHIATMTSWSSISWCILLYAIIKQVAQNIWIQCKISSKQHSSIHSNSLPFREPIRVLHPRLSSRGGIISNQNHPATRGILVRSFPNSNILWKTVTPPKSQHSFKEGQNVHT